MSDIHELNERRARLWLAVQNFNAVNWPTDPEGQLKLDCEARLMRDAWMWAEKEYSDAMMAVSVDELIAITKVSK